MCGCVACPCAFNSIWNWFKRQRVRELLISIPQMTLHFLYCCCQQILHSVPAADVLCFSFLSHFLPFFFLFCMVGGAFLCRFIIMASVNVENCVRVQATVCEYLLSYFLHSLSFYLSVCLSACLSVCPCTKQVFLGPVWRQRLLFLCCFAAVQIDFQ